MAEETLAQKNALQLIQDRFASYGIQGLAEVVRKLIAQYTNANSNEVSDSLVMAGIRATPEYMKRFAGNIERQKKIDEDIAAGRQPRFGRLSEADYVQAEKDYRTVLSEYNIPGFYDTPDSYINLIGNDISPKEVQARAMSAQQAASRANPEIRQQLKAMYGIEENQIAAYFLDPEQATTVLKPVAAANAATLAAAAQRSGLGLSQADAERISQNLAPGTTDTIAADVLFQQTSLTAGLAGTSVSGEQSIIGTEDVLTAAAGDTTSQDRLRKEREKRLATTRASSGMGETAKGVVGLQSANI